MRYVGEAGLFLPDGVTFSAEFFGECPLPEFGGFPCGVGKFAAGEVDVESQVQSSNEPTSDFGARIDVSLVALFGSETCGADIEAGFSLGVVWVGALEFMDVEHF